MRYAWSSTVKLIVGALLLSCAITAEKKFDFGEYPLDKTPPGFRSTVAGSGKPGDWRTLMDEVAPTLAPLSPNAPVVTRRAVLAQLARDGTDEHFPILVYEEETFGDFAFTLGVERRLHLHRFQR